MADLHVHRVHLASYWSSARPQRSRNNGGTSATACEHVHHKHIDDSMRRKRSDELPRFVNDRESSRFRWNRRYSYILAGFILVCWVLYPSRNASQANNDASVNWSNYAYSFYATDSATLCHAVLLADALTRLGSKADRVLFYPEYWDTEVTDSKDRDSQLLVMARDKYKVKLHPIKLLTVGGVTKGTNRGLHTLETHPSKLSL
jgi:hypothetical protein